LAVWTTANNTTYTAGTPQDPNPIHPDAGLDGGFTSIPPDAAGSRGASFEVIGCCLKSGYCAEPAPNEGVFLVVDWVMNTPGGNLAGTSDHVVCPGTCASITVIRTEATPGGWGGAVTSIDIDVTVQCICCGEGIEIGDDVYDFDPERLDD